MNSQRTSVEKAAYEVGLKVDTWHPGDGATRYRFFREDKIDVGGTYDYFGGSNALTTVLGRKAAYAFIEAYRYGRNAGIREARAEVITGLESPNVSVNRREAVVNAVDNLIDKGPWHYGRTLTAAEEAIIASGGKL